MKSDSVSCAHWVLCDNTLHLGTVGVCLAWSSPLLRYCCSVDCLYCDRNIENRTLYYILQWDWKLEIHRIWNKGIPYHGSGATVQSVSRCLLVMKTSIPLFHDGMQKLELWNHSINECSFLCFRRKKEERFLCGPRCLSTSDLEGDTFRHVRDNLTDAQLEAQNESCAIMTIKTIRRLTSSSSILFDEVTETMRHWTRRFTRSSSKVGKSLNASNATNKWGFSAREHLRHVAV